MWTPSERRGATLLLLLFALGTLWDLTHVRPVTAPAPAAAPPPPEAAAPPGPVANTPSPGTLLDLNRATTDELDALPGIGPVLARRIVEQRGRLGGFRAPADLRSVRGIGPRLFERLRAHVSAQAADPRARRQPVQIASGRAR